MENRESRESTENGRTNGPLVLADSTIARLADAIAARVGALVPARWPADRLTLREPEVARLLGVGHDKLIGLRRAGAIAHRKIGHTIAYAPADVAAYIEACRRAGEG